MFLTGDIEDRVIPDNMNHVFLSLGRYSENFVLISSLEVCQEGGGHSVPRAGKNSVFVPHRFPSKP